MVNVGILGCGSISKLRHAPEYHANRDCRIAGYFDPVAARAEELAAEYGGRVYKDYKEMLDDRNVDAVSVCTSNKYHAAISIEALQAGKHVLCEKPIAVTVEEGLRMIGASKEAGKFLMVGHNQRLAPAHIKAKEILAGGELGRILSFSTSFSHGGPENWGVVKNSNTWFFKKDNAVLGAMGDLGIHKADLIRWLIDDEIYEVKAYLATLDKKYGDGSPIDVEDHAVCILKSRRGITGSLTASWTCYGDEENSTVLYCSKGVMKIFDHSDFPITVTKRNGEKIFYKVEGIQTNSNQTHSGVIDMFIRGIVDNVQPEISGEEGLAALKIVLAFVEASKTGAAVNVEGG